MPVLTDWTLDIAIEDVFRDQQADADQVRQRRPGLYAMAQEAVAEALDCIEPRVTYLQLAVLRVERDRIILDGDFPLTSRVVARQLKQARQVVVALCTIGEVLELRASQAMSERGYAYGYALGSAGTVALDNLVRSFYYQVEEQALADSEKLSHRFSPGIKTWPVTEGQPEIFAILEGLDSRIQLLPSRQMRPLKSVSTVFGIGAEVRRRGSLCDICEMRSRCSHRECLQKRDKAELSSR